MSEFTEKRREKRLRYHWPVWFDSDFDGNLTQGQMVDVSSGGAAFTCYSDSCPNLGQHITARFSVPKYEDADAFDMESVVCQGQICRIQEISPFLRRVAVQFSENLPFKPGEQEDEAISNSPLQTAI